MSYNTSYVDDVILYQNETLYMAARFHHLRTKTQTDKSVVPDYVFDMITNPILMKTSVTTGKVEWAKQFMNKTETNDNPYSLWIILDIKLTDNIWIRIDKANDISTSKFIEVNKDNGSVLSSFHLENKQNGF